MHCVGGFWSQLPCLGLVMVIAPLFSPRVIHHLRLVFYNSVSHTCSQTFHYTPFNCSMRICHLFLVANPTDKVIYELNKHLFTCIYLLLKSSALLVVIHHREHPNPKSATRYEPQSDFVPASTWPSHQSGLSFNFSWGSWERNRVHKLLWKHSIHAA